jgi:hypothetical protein
MTQEEKELLSKDLYGRLLYDVIVQETFQDAKRDVPVWDCGPHYIKDHPEKVKPYLRPLSSMTEEESEEYKSITESFIGFNIGEDTDWLNAHHFDYRGLIPKGLALEAPKDMYK